MGVMKAWWAWLYDRASGSHMWALILGLLAADSLSRAHEIHGWWYVERLLVAVIEAKWALSVWHKAEERRALKEVAKRVRP